MNLADMLGYADIYDLSRIAKNYACECNGNSKHELMQSILIAVNRRDVFEQQMNELSMEDIRFLNFLIFNQREAFSVEDLLARAKQTKFNPNEAEEWNPRDLITSFKHRGWLFNGYSQQTKYLLHVPVDLKRKFIDALTVKFKLNICSLSDFPSIYRDEQSLIVDDIVSFLKFISQHDIQLSTDGYIYKRFLLQILDSFSVHEEGVAKTAWRFGYGRKFKEYPARFSFIYDYCYFHNLIIEKGEQLALTDQGKTKLAEGRKEDILQVYRFWLKLYKGAIPNLQSLMHWIDRLAKQWVSQASLAEVLCPLIKSYYYDSSESIFENRMIPLMMHLGLVRIGEDGEYGRVLQVSKLGSSLIQGIYVADEDAIDLKLTPSALA
ncbi:MAG: hypothetical protein JWM44_3950 [Bacilli bacterium]|nr:hypothetical protein [Bacilli bacterium]